MILLMYLVVLISLPTFGCPEFAGEFNNCINTFTKVSKPFKVKITQKRVGDYTEYTWRVEKNTPHVINADGKERTEVLLGPDSKTQMTVQTTTNCIGDKIVSSSHTVYGKEIKDDVQTLFKQEGQVILRNSSQTSTVDVVCKP